MLGSAERARLQAALAYIEPHYTELIWEPAQADLQKQLGDMRRESERVEFGARLGDVAALLDSPWNRPFVVALVPIPRDKGEKIITHGHSDGFLQVVEAPYGGGGADRLSVILHELVHALYLTRRVKLDFPPSARLAQAQLNEGLATALGNGWMYRLLSGAVDDKPWYHDRYIDGYGRALLPLLEPYLQSRRSLDAAFVERAARVFAERFPQAERDPELVLREVYILGDDPRMHDASFRRFLPSRVHSLYMVRSLTLESFREHEGVTAVLLVRPQDVDKLEAWSLPADVLAQAARATKPMAVATRQDSRWVILCVGKTLEEQAQAMRSVLEGGQL